MNSVRSFFPCGKDTQNLPMQQNQLITIRKLFNYILQKILVLNTIQFESTHIIYFLVNSWNL